MNAKIVQELYKELTKQNAGSREVKFDLHIHSPASKDFTLPNNMSKRDAYLGILNEVKKNNIEIIAITDHNTFNGFNELREILCDYEIRKSYKGITILCGIEITCFAQHLLAIFDISFSIEQQNNFLHDIGIDVNTYGNEEIMADELGPARLLEVIDKYGGISILAHADSQKGFLYSFCRPSGSQHPEIVFKGKSLAKIIKSPNLYGVQICNRHNEDKISQVLKNSDYKRADRPLPFLTFSDSHGIRKDGSYIAKSGKPIGEAYSLAKLSYRSFSAIKIALSDPGSRILKNSYSSVHPYIIGCCINSPILKKEGAQFSLFKFNNEMNCVIGARGTGKSTLLGIIKDVLQNNDILDSGNGIASRYNAALVFLNHNEDIYAVSCDFEDRDIKKVYKKSKTSNKFEVYHGNVNFLKLYITKVYQQRELYTYSMDSNKILEIVDDFVMWKNYEKYGDIIQELTRYKTELEEMFKRYYQLNMKISKPLFTYISEEGLEKKYLTICNCIIKANEDIRNLRDKFIIEINKILFNKVNLTLCNRFDKDSENYLTIELPKQVARKTGRYYDYEVKIKSFMQSIIEKSKLRFKFDFFHLLIGNGIDNVIKEYRLKNDKTTKQYLSDILQSVDLAGLVVFSQDGINLKYNINTGFENANPNFKDNTQISMGQNAVALLLIILSATQQLHDNRPLLMDQPEDDLDNSYIYNALVKQFRDNKKNRQLIISTHNANIPVASDAENIIVLEYNGQYGYLSQSGSIENPRISHSILNILEGGELAIKSRNEKYKNIKK